MKPGDNTKAATGVSSLAETGSYITKEEFCSLYGKHKDNLYRYALYRLGDPGDAEDAVSDCVLAAWQSIGKLRSKEAFGAWIFSILRNCCASHIKEAIRQRKTNDQIIEDPSSDIGASASGNYSGTPGGIGAVHPGSLGIELAEALDMLADDEREIVLLSVLGGLSSREIASEVGLTSGSVRSKLSRSLAKMREFLEYVN